MLNFIARIKKHGIIENKQDIFIFSKLRYDDVQYHRFKELSSQLEYKYNTQFYIKFILTTKQPDKKKKNLKFFMVNINKYKQILFFDI